jgi:glycosyltransferase involved in cell wall biosynthesis
MKILSILTYYHPHWTGLTAIAKRIAEGLAARGHEVTVLTTQHERGLPRESVEGDVRVLRLPTAGRVSRGMVAPSLLPVAARLCAAHDVVQLHTPFPEAAPVAALGRLCRRPVLVTHQGDLVMPAGLGNRLVQAVGNLSLNGAARLAGRITTNSPDYAEHSSFLRPYAGKIVPIHPPVDIVEPDQTAAREWRKELGLDGKTVVGFAGRFVEEKGFDYLLRCVPELAAGVPDVHLVYAGEHRVVYESFYERCRPLIEAAGDRLTFVGLIRDRQRLADFYAMCDVFALPSRSDCFPAVQVESMLCGTPVIATDIPGARDVVMLTGMGRLVAPRHPGALAAGLVSVIRDRDRLARPRSEIRAIFDPQQSIDRYESVFLELAGEAS